jgi:hypothetical protein
MRITLGILGHGGQLASENRDNVDGGFLHGVQGNSVVGKPHHPSSPALQDSHLRHVRDNHINTACLR